MLFIGLKYFKSKNITFIKSDIDVKEGTIQGIWCRGWWNIKVDTCSTLKVKIYIENEVMNTLKRMKLQLEYELRLLNE